nr:hypothetical protein [Kibdelosporangium sp. MJ126-NF4]
MRPLVLSGSPIVHLVLEVDGAQSSATQVWRHRTVLHESECV